MRNILNWLIYPIACMRLGHAATRRFRMHGLIAELKASVAQRQALVFELEALRDSARDEHIASPCGEAEERMAHYQELVIRYRSELAADKARLAHWQEVDL